MRRYPFYLVSTPIGNLGDITHRAVEVLGSVDLVLAEDTRKARVLLSRYGIAARPQAFHDHNKERVTPTVIERIRGGASVALITDAGTPGISDPGFFIVRALIAEGIEFTAIPGPSAVTQALVLSGFPTDRFTFFGYMPRKKGARERLIVEASASAATAVFFESPYRLLDTLAAVASLLPDREVAVVREATKLHEETVRGPAAEVAAHFRGRVRGEATLLIKGAERRGARGTA
jgi:16S rRNA (cytidine1402-2'-O)-methyltransferase